MCSINNIDENMNITKQFKRGWKIVESFYLE